MVKMLKKIKGTDKPLNKEDENKINTLLKTYETGTIEFNARFLEFDNRDDEIETFESIELLLTSD